MIVELHIIQNFAPANLNRDDANMPKDCKFGGYRRARISSQCIKRSVRRHETFKKTIQNAGGDIGVRTKRVIGKIADLLTESHGKSKEESQKVAEQAITLFGVKRDDKRDDKPADKTKIILYLGENELQDIAEISVKHWDAILASEVAVEDEAEEENETNDKKKKKKQELTPQQKAIQKELQSVVSEERLRTGAYAADIALFGRMVADKSVKNMNVDAACQVAHAISTNKVEMEMDYFTAVDDLLPDEESGSDMIGIVEFNSSCFYRYSLIDLNKLRKNLGLNDDLLKATVLGFLESSVKAIPTGKQNSMAAQNPPDYARVIIRKDGFPWSLVNAFQKPIYAKREESVEEQSIAALDDYFNHLSRIYGKDDIICNSCFNLYDPKSKSMTQMLEEVSNKLLASEEVTK
jgi:CRISPR system Cascade subunit CasC